jgi:hypothetical protein
MRRRFKLIEKRAFRPIVAMAAFREIGDRVPDRRHLGDLAVKSGHVIECQRLTSRLARFRSR